MADINAATAFENSVRAAEITNANITDMVFSQTLQSSNTLMPFVQPWAVTNTQNFVTKDFPSSFTRNDKQWGIDGGELKASKYERYSFGLENWHSLHAWDITDTIDKAFDPIARITTQLRYAEERLVSQVSLRGLIEPVNMVSPDPTADGGNTLAGGTGYIAAKIGVVKKIRCNTWWDKDTAVSDFGGKATATAYGGAYHPLTTYAHIRHQFRLREVSVPLCILATPCLMRTLDLWNGETNFPYGKHAASQQVVAPLEQNKYNDMGSLSSFMWQGFRHVVAYHSAMPPAKFFGDPDNSDQPYISKQKVATANTDITIPVKNLCNKDQDRRIAQFTLPAIGGITAAAANNASNVIKLYTDGADSLGALPARTYAEVDTKINWLTYVWSPAMLMFAYAPTLFIRNKLDTVIRLKDARFLLTRLCVGSFCKDPDYYMKVILRVKPSADALNAGH